MRVALFGATGFIGSYLVDALLAAGHEPAALVRPGSEHRLRQPERCLPIAGTIDDRAAIAATLRECEAAIYLPGLLRENPRAGVTFQAIQYEGARRVMQAAAEQGVRRFLLMSANGASADGTPYQRTKYAAERELADSQLEGTVFRPSVVFGDPRGRMEFCTQLKGQMIDPPIPAPAFFRGLSPRRGGFRMSPVHVEDVAQAFVRSLDDPATVGQVYPLGGPETLDWPDIVRRIAAAAGRRKWIVPAPAGPMLLVCKVFDRFAWFPLTADQLTMLLEGNSVTSRAAFERLEITPRPMTSEALAYLRR
ncbi:MAG: NAD(P)H-binding protein [Woeseiaceae bacterium]|nr:NAD(P)H-binding protein [Woeseiaceae bacterium]